MAMVGGLRLRQYRRYAPGRDFYWVTILLSQTLGTALGDWMADTNGLGYEGGASSSPPV